MTQKNKNILLIVGFILSLFISYKLAISKTIETKVSLAILEKQTITFDNIARLSANLKQREKFADSILIKNNIKNTSIQNNLLEFLNNEHEDDLFTITNFKEPHHSVKENVISTFYQFTLKGDFKTLLEVIFKLEQQYNFGKISHVSFEKKRNYRKRKDYLECFIVVESFISE